MPSSSAASTTAAARPGTRSWTVSKNVVVHRVARCRPTTRARSCTRDAIAVRPSGPWYTAYIDAITASSTCAVQMFDVAFSRRMCCSRVCSANRYADVAVGIDGHADEPAGQRALEPGTDRHESGVRAAEHQRHTESLRRSDCHVRTQRAGERSRHRASRSVATATSRAALVRGRRCCASSRRSDHSSGVLHEQPEDVAVGQPVARHVGDDDGQSERLGPRLARRRWSADGSPRR